MHYPRLDVDITLRNNRPMAPVKYMAGDGVFSYFTNSVLHIQTKNLATSRFWRYKIHYNFWIFSDDSDFANILYGNGRRGDFIIIAI